MIAANACSASSESVILGLFFMGLGVTGLLTFWIGLGGEGGDGLHVLHLCLG